MNEPMLWLVLLIAFAGIEGLTAGLVSIWFCLGSLAALFAAWLGGSLMVQIALFAIVSVIAMAVIRPLARKWIQPRQAKTRMPLPLADWLVCSAPSLHDIWI